MNLNKIAVHAFNEALARNPVLAAQVDGARCDRLFDGGEWSDAYHAEEIESIADGICARVAARFGMTETQLDNQYRQWCEESMPWNRPAKELA